MGFQRFWLWLLKMLISDMSGSLLPKNHDFPELFFCLQEAKTWNFQEQPDFWDQP
jgi:hypothetical protein